MIKVLVVEDSPVVREFLVHILGSDPDIQVIGTANDGEEALEAVRRTQPNVITMDIHMPKMNGLEATRAIRALPAGGATPILAMTANAFDEDRAQCLAAGMDDFVPKPFDPDDLYGILLKWLAQGQASGREARIAVDNNTITPSQGEK